MRVLGDAWTWLSNGANWQGSDGATHLLLQQLLITVTALLIALAIGLPLALFLGHKGRGGFLAINITNVGRAIPTFALLGLLVTADWPGTAVLGPYGRGGLATLLALALFALPPIVTNGYVAIREVPEDVKESARGMGMTGPQLFWRVELPLAMPLVLGACRLALVQVWATATLAALVAGPGLGNVITEGFYGYQYGQAIGGAVIVAVVALLLEGAAALGQHLISSPFRNPLGRRKPDHVTA